VIAKIFAVFIKEAGKKKNNKETPNNLLAG
jgi:hypothetical protein